VNELARRLPDAVAAESELAKEAVTASLAQLPVGTSRRVMEQVRDRVLAPLQQAISERQAEERAEREKKSQEFDHQQRCEAEVRRVWLHLPGDAPGERKEAEEAVRKALAGLAVNSSQKDLEATRDTAIAPICKQITARLDREMRQSVIDGASLPWFLPQEDRERALAEILVNLNAHTGAARPELEKIRDRICAQYRAKHEQGKQREELIEGGLRGIPAYLATLQAKWEFEKPTYTLEQELREPVGQALREELDGDESPEEVGKVTRRLVRRALDIAPSRAA